MAIALRFQIEPNHVKTEAAIKASRWQVLNDRCWMKGWQCQNFKFAVARVCWGKGIVIDGWPQKIEVIDSFPMEKRSVFRKLIALPLSYWLMEPRPLRWHALMLSCLLWATIWTGHVQQALPNNWPLKWQICPVASSVATASESLTFPNSWASDSKHVKTFICRLPSRLLGHGQTDKARLCKILPMLAAPTSAESCTNSAATSETWTLTFKQWKDVKGPRRLHTHTHTHGAPNRVKVWNWYTGFNAEVNTESG